MIYFLKKTALLFFTIFILLYPPYLYALINQFQIWPGVDVTGRLDRDKWKYNFDLQPRIVPSQSKHLERIVTNLGAGYSYSQQTTFWFGGTYLTTNRDESSVHNPEYRLWQQINFKIYNKPTFNLISATQLEQRKDVDQGEIGLELRQKMEASFPRLIFSKYKLIMYDELFFNLDKASWVSPKLFDRNRAFLGLGIPLKRYTDFRIGYLNQYEIRSVQNKMDSILLMSIDFNFT